MARINDLFHQLKQVFPIVMLITCVLYLLSFGTNISMNDSISTPDLVNSIIYIIFLALGVYLAFSDKKKLINIYVISFVAYITLFRMFSLWTELSDNQTYAAYQIFSILTTICLIAGVVLSVLSYNKENETLKAAGALVIAIGAILYLIGFICNILYLSDAGFKSNYITPVLFNELSTVALIISFSIGLHMVLDFLSE